MGRLYGGTFPIDFDRAGLWERLALRFDPAHTVALRTHLDALDWKKDPDLAPMAGLTGLQDAFDKRIAALRADILARFDLLRVEDEAFLPSRLAEPLAAAGWIVALDGNSRWQSVGQGWRPLFHQVFHGRVADLERVVVQAGTRVRELDQRMARDWSQLALADPHLRVLACLEEGMRRGEEERLLALRTSFVPACEKLFASWAPRALPVLPAPDDVILVERLAHQLRPPKGRGFQGCAMTLCDLARDLARTGLDLICDRWSLFVHAPPSSSPPSTAEPPP